MNNWIREVHTYTGLISFTALTLFGLLGIVATVLPPPRERPKPETTVQFVDIVVPGELDDRQLADYLQARLNLPLTNPAPSWSLRRDQENNLRFRLPTPGKAHDVIVLETENRLRIETAPFDYWQYLFHLHEMTPQGNPSDIRTQLWAYYMEFNIWALILMGITGIYLWLTTKRRRLWWAQLAFLTGTCSFVVLYVVMR